jgi:hypothetical protein
LLPMSGSNVKTQGPAGDHRRYCAVCRRATDMRARPITAEEVVAVSCSRNVRPLAACLVVVMYKEHGIL